MNKETAESPRLLTLVLDGKFGPDGKPVSAGCHRRVVTIDPYDESELGDVQWFFDAYSNTNRWGLGNENDGWWAIVDHFEAQEPTEHLHEDKYPVAYGLSDDEFSRLVKEYNS